MLYQERDVRWNGYRIHVRDYPGESPAIVLLHGFPDNLHLYDRLIPHLNPTRRVVTFDFLGWGASDKPTDYRPTADSQTLELDSVINQLDLETVVLVAHDSSGPPAIDWALTHPDRIASLVLLNTYYQATLSLKRPPAIALYSTPIVKRLARWVMRRSDELDRKLYYWQVGRFISDPEVRDELVPQLYTQFRAARPAFWALNDDLLGAVISRRKMIPTIGTFQRPVRIIFGDGDPWMTPGVAAKFHELFPNSELSVLPRARHYVQVDKPAEVARLILAPLPPLETPRLWPPGPESDVGFRG
jgi:haloalkane dehalogenase